MRKALFVSAYFPSSAVPAAGNRLAAAWLDQIAQTFDQVDVIAFRSGHEPPSADIINIENSSLHVFEISLFARLLATVIFPHLPAGVAVRRLLGRRTASAVAQDDHYHAVFVDFVQGMDVLPPILQRNAELRVHDVMSQLYYRHSKAARGLRRLIAIVELWRSRCWEPKVWRRAMRLKVLTEKDATLVRSTSAREDILIDTPTQYYRVAGRKSQTIERNTILFWGNMSRNENREAVLAFERNIFPIILKSIPDAHFIVAGANPTYDIMKLQNKNISITGFVDKPDDLFRRCALAVVPLKTGAGIKIKVLEFLAAGIPTISTSVGAEGILATENLFVEDDELLFAKKCIQTLEQADQLKVNERLWD